MILEMQKTLLKAWMTDSLMEKELSFNQQVVVHIAPFQCIYIYIYIYIYTYIYTICIIYIYIYMRVCVCKWDIGMKKGFRDRRSRGPQPGDKCYNCGKTGHW